MSVDGKVAVMSVRMDREHLVISFDGKDAEVTISKSSGRRCRVVVESPDGVKVYRKQVRTCIEEGGAQ